MMELLKNSKTLFVDSQQLRRQFKGAIAISQPFSKCLIKNKKVRPYSFLRLFNLKKHCSFGESCEKIDDKSGQMAVELSIVFPIMIIVAVVLVNALSFASECARFDREARNAIRCEASTPAINEGYFGPASRIESALQSSFSASNESISVSASKSSLFTTRYECELMWSPTLFGIGMKTSVFGVQLFQLSHKCALSVDPYRAGDVL